MSKQYNIQWRRSDYSRLSHLERKVNAKIFGVQVKRPDIAEYQPEMVTYQNLKEQVKTRKDLEHIIKRYERYLRDGAEEVIRSDKGAVATKWEVKEFNINQRAENARRRAVAKKLGEKKVTIAGEDTGAKRKEMGSTKENAVKPSEKKFKNQSQEEWERASKLFESRMRSTYNDEKRREAIRRYVKGLIAEGYPEELLQILNKVNPDKFMEIMDTDEVATFDFIYDPAGVQAVGELLIKLWSAHTNESVNNNLDFAEIEREVVMEYESGLRIKGQGRIRQPKKRKRR